MALSNSNGPSGNSDRKPSPFADRRVVILLVTVVAIAGYFAFQSWRSSAIRDIARSKLLLSATSELQKAAPDLDELSKLMAGLKRLPDSSIAAEILAVRAGIELARGNPEKADDLFGSIAAGPGALPADQRLGSRILLAKHEGFGGDVVVANTMLQQAQAMAKVAYSDSGDVADLFRAWLASIRLWDPSAADLAQQLKAAHADSPENRMVELNADFKPMRDQSKIDDLMVDFVKPPAELGAMKTLIQLEGGDIAGALKAAEDQANQSPGVQGVRLIAAFVLHGCALGSPEGSVDRAGFIRRRNVHLDWLDGRAPVRQARQWDQMRKFR